jgi:hypothetical protein
LTSARQKRVLANLDYLVVRLRKGKYKPSKTTEYNAKEMVTEYIRQSELRRQKWLRRIKT